MGDVISLNKIRKAQEKVAKSAQAAANRVRFGLPKDQRAGIRKTTDKAKTDLDNKRLD